MPTYIMLSTLTPEGVQTIKNNPARIREVNREVEQLGATVKAQWATLGQFDFVNVVEAPDEKTMARVSLELGSRGTGQVRDPDRDPDRRLHWRDLNWWAARPPESWSSGAAGASTRSSRRCALAARARSSCARPATPGSPATPGLSTSRPRTSTGRVPRRVDERVDLVVVGPEAPLVAGLADALRDAGDPLLRPDRGARRGSRARRRSARR